MILGQIRAGSEILKIGSGANLSWSATLNQTQPFPNPSYFQTQPISKPNLFPHSWHQILEGPIAHLFPNLTFPKPTLFPNPTYFRTPTLRRPYCSPTIISGGPRGTLFTMTSVGSGKTSITDILGKTSMKEMSLSGQLSFLRKKGNIKNINGPENLASPNFPKII